MAKKVLVHAILIINKLVACFAVSSGISLTMIAVVVFIEVILRKLGHATSWAYFASTYLQVFLVFLGLAWLQNIEENVKVEILLKRLSFKWQNRIAIFSSLILMLLAALLVWQSFMLLRRSIIGHVSTFGEIMIPVVYIQWSVHVGFFLLFMVSLKQFIQRLLMLSNQREHRKNSN